METKLSVADLERDGEAALERVRGGGRVVVERDGEPVAVLAPPAPADPKPVTSWRELAELLHHLPPLDDGFAADLAAIRAEQPLACFPEWPD